MAYRNSEDQRAASKKHYYANKQKYLAKNKIYRAKISEFIQDIKSSTPCADCGRQYPYYVMDFDHLNDKKDEVNFLASSGRSKALKIEIEKCDIVCSNCHRIRTHNRLE